MGNQPTNNPLSAHAGPYETSAAATAASSDVYAAAGIGPGALEETNHSRLLDTCKAAGVYLGAYDHRIVRWLAGNEPETVVVIVGLITRAYYEGERTGSGGDAPPDLEALSDDELVTLLLNQVGQFGQIEAAAKRTGDALRARGQAQRAQGQTS